MLLLIATNLEKNQNFFAFDRKEIPLLNFLKMKMQSTESAGRHMGSKSLIAAPLWAERYQNILARFHKMHCDNVFIQILHHKGFAVRVPANITSNPFFGSR